MSARGEPLDFYDFSGGRNSFDPEFLVPANQAVDLQNVNLLENGWMKRQGNVAFNSASMVGASTPIVGMDYMKFNSGTEFLNAVAGTKFFVSTSLSGTMSDRTGSLTITSAQENFWTAVSLANLQVWFGGAPNAPFSFDGSGGNATALTGTPPSARTAFVSNNRIFAISTAADPSRIQWPVLANPNDWTGTGSGNADVSKNDGEELLQGVLLGEDTAILFKNTSTHFMILTKSPFPVYQLQKGTGAGGRNAIVNVNGTIYFITPSRRMKSTTDGKNFEEYPSSVDDLWNRVNPNRIPFIQGVYYPERNQIHWLVSLDSNLTNDSSIIWDIRRKAWLYHPSGFKANRSCLVQGRRLFTGHYNGKMFEQDRISIYTDASESPSLINAYWRMPWIHAKSAGGVIHPHWIDATAISGNTTMSVAYGFDFIDDRNTTTFNLNSSSDIWDTAVWNTAVWGGQTSTIKRVFVRGRGNVFSMKFGNAVSGESLVFQGVSVQPRTEGANKKLPAI